MKRTSYETFVRTNQLRGVQFISKPAD